MNSLGDIIPEKEIPDGEPWRGLLKGDAYQMCDYLIVRDQSLQIMQNGGGTRAVHEFFIGSILIDGELDALLLLPHRRRARLPKAFQYEDYHNKVLRPLPPWDKTRWAIRVGVHVPYSEKDCRYPLYDCRSYPKDADGEDPGERWKGWRWELTDDDTEETEELQRRFSLKRVAGKYPALPDIPRKPSVSKSEELE